MSSKSVARFGVSDVSGCLGVWCRSCGGLRVHGMGFGLPLVFKVHRAHGLTASDFDPGPSQEAEYLIRSNFCTKPDA